ncbi:hypothetical protein DFH09DRAFT_1477296 [Mycena vulgaris]|nr:hypothetical protein DFH09DRAFT_1477296 [Mycena vulgaris]
MNVPTRITAKTPTPTAADTASAGVSEPPESQQPPHPSPASADTPSNGNSKSSVTNVDNLALAVNLIEKIANVVDRVPFAAPVAALVSEILKIYKDVKETHENRDTLYGRHKNSLGISTGRLLKKASALVFEFDSEGGFKTTLTHAQWTAKFTGLERDLDSFALRFNFKHLIDLEIGQDGIRKALDQVQLSALAEKLRKWLQSPPDMLEKQNTTQALHQPGTGAWFLNGRQFAEWKENPGALWIEGQSGAGKSVMSSTVIRELFETRTRAPAAFAVAYFYFDFRDEKKQIVEIMLRSIILQLSAQSRDPYGALDLWYEACNGQTLPPYQNLLEILDALLLEIILDALDECKDTDLQVLLRFISKLQGTKKPLNLLSIRLSPAEIRRNTFHGLGTTLSIRHARLPFDLRLATSATVGDVLVALHRTLHLGIKHGDWEMLRAADQVRVNDAFVQRYRAEALRSRVPPDTVRAKGVKRVDFLLGKTVFKGLTRSPDDPEGWVRMVTE